MVFFGAANSLPNVSTAYHDALANGFISFGDWSSAGEEGGLLAWSLLVSVRRVVSIDTVGLMWTNAAEDDNASTLTDETVRIRMVDTGSFIVDS